MASKPRSKASRRAGPGLSIGAPGREVAVPVSARVRAIPVRVAPSRIPAAAPRLRAANDSEAVAAWLALYHDRPATLASYTREARRLMIWASEHGPGSLGELAHEDMLVYERFLADPQPAERWIGPKRRPLTSPDWRPFAAPLEAASVRHALVVLNGMLEWLWKAGWLAHNPLALAATRRRRIDIPGVPAAGAVRLIRHSVLGVLGEVVRPEEGASDGALRAAARDRWALAVFWQGLRISEAASARMSDLVSERAADGASRSWLVVRGKGAKVRWVPVGEDFIAERVRYRLAMGLPAQCAQLEDLPLVLPLRGEPRALSRMALHSMVKSIFERACERLRALGRADDAAALSAASAHWVRHTVGSDLINRRRLPVVMARDILGHGNISTTNTYSHTERDELHDATVLVHRLPWDEPQAASPDPSGLAGSR